MLGETSKITLKIEIFGGIFRDRNLSSNIRVGVRVPSLLTEMRLNAMTGTSQLRPSQKSSSGRLVSNLMIPWEKIKVERMYADKLCSERRGDNRHLLREN